MMSCNSCAALALLGAALAWGCGDDGASGEDAGSAGAAGAADSATAGAAAGPGNSECQEGCVATLAADCANGPASQAKCEADCEFLASGACAAPYQALQACAQGEAITCNGAGLPSVAACSAEQTTFVACLN